MLVQGDDLPWSLTTEPVFSSESESRCRGCRDHSWIVNGKTLWRRELIDYGIVKLGGLCTLGLKRERSVQIMYHRSVASPDSGHVHDVS